MYSISLAVIQLIIPVAVGLLVTTYLGEATQRLLVDLCGTPERARFWVRCVSVVTVALPLMLVIFLAQSPLQCADANADCTLQTLRQTLAATIAGCLIAVGVMACGVGKRVPPAVSGGEAKRVSS